MGIYIPPEGLHFLHRGCDGRIRGDMSARQEGAPWDKADDGGGFGYLSIPAGLLDFFTILMTTVCVHGMRKPGWLTFWSSGGKISEREAA